MTDMGFFDIAGRLLSISPFWGVIFILSVAWVLLLFAAGVARLLGRQLSSLANDLLGSVKVQAEALKLEFNQLDWWSRAFAYDVSSGTGHERLEEGWKLVEEAQENAVRRMVINVFHADSLSVTMQGITRSQWSRIVDLEKSSIDSGRHFILPVGRGKAEDGGEPSPPPFLSKAGDSSPSPEGREQSANLDTSESPDPDKAPAEPDE
jgi:hypothetical protein